MKQKNDLAQRRRGAEKSKTDISSQRFSGGKVLVLMDLPW